MGTPKKPVKTKAASKSTGAQSEDSSADMPAKKRIVDEDDDEDFDIPLDDLGRYESFDGYDDDDDY